MTVKASVMSPASWTPVRTCHSQYGHALSELVTYYSPGHGGERRYAPGSIG